MDTTIACRFPLGWIEFINKGFISFIQLEIFLSLKEFRPNIFGIFSYFDSDKSDFLEENLSCSIIFPQNEHSIVDKFNLWSPSWHPFVLIWRFFKPPAVKPLCIRANRKYIQAAVHFNSMCSLPSIAIFLRSVQRSRYHFGLSSSLTQIMLSRQTKTKQLSKKTLILIEDSLKKIVYPCEKFGKNSGFESNQLRLTKTTKIAIGTVFPSPFSRTGTTFANFCFGQHLFLFVSAQHVKYQY